MEKILLDTDIGGDIDDAVCLAYLLKEPECELLGITTVCGESEKRAAVADAICRAAGRAIPIVAGCDTTLQPIPVYPTPDGAAALKHWPHGIFEKSDAPAFLYQKIRENPHEITLIGIGNMTNIALLFRAHPDAPELLKGLFVMNGYFGADPLPDPYYNWNSWADPLASKIVFASRVATHRVIPLEVTDLLTIEATQASTLLAADSNLMKAVFDFGAAWLESAGKLTLHDPLAAVSVFHPELCRFERGSVQVETKREERMGATAFTPDAGGNVEIARTVDRERFYQLLSATLNGSPSGRKSNWIRRRILPPPVVSRAKAAGAAGEAWLANLDQMVAELEAQWNIAVGEALHGGTHAFAAFATGQHGEEYVIKIDLPDDTTHADFLNGVSVLRAADGCGYPKLFACDIEKRACLMERLGTPLGELHLPVLRQLEVICGALEKTWRLSVDRSLFPNGDDSIAWFRAFISQKWEELRRPCPQGVIDRAMAYLQSREEQKNPADYVLLHGDAHGSNTLQELGAQGGFKLIDPDGLIYEKAYDLGVLMREWPEEYQADPVGSGRRRCEYLHSLTGVDRNAIWEWGFLQTVSTAFILLQIGQEETGYRMLKIAEAWC